MLELGCHKYGQKIVGDRHASWVKERQPTDFLDIV